MLTGRCETCGVHLVEGIHLCWFCDPGNAAEQRALEAEERAQEFADFVDGQDGDELDDEDL